MNQTEHSPFQLSIDRLRSLCDVVMGAVLVVLVLNIDIPSLSQIKVSHDVTQVFVVSFPAFFAFLTCFLVVAKCWELHNLLFHHVKQVDKRILWLTIFYLLSVAFLVSTAGIHMQPHDQISVIAFSTTLMMPALLLSAMCVRVVYAWRLDESIYLSEGRKRAAVILLLKTFLIPLVGIVSIILSYVNAIYAYYLWTAILLIIFI